MAKRRKILLGLCGMFGVVILAASILFLPLSNTVSYHNNALRQCLSQDMEIQIQCRSSRDPGTFSKTVEVTERDRQTWLLDRFMLDRLSWQLGGSHGCHGHLLITVKTPKHTYRFQYDHGIGIYPITNGSPYRRFGFLDMEPSVCEELNQYFRSIGFSDEDLGIGGNL